MTENPYSLSLLGHIVSFYCIDKGIINRLLVYKYLLLLYNKKKADTP